MTDIDVLARLTRLESQVSELLHEKRERDRLACRGHHDAIEYRRHADSGRLPQMTRAGNREIRSHLLYPVELRDLPPVTTNVTGPIWPEREADGLQAETR